MNRNFLSDSQLIASYKNGNEEAFRELLEKHQSRIFTTIYLIVKDRTIAEDLFQEVLFKVIDTLKQGRYKEEGKFLPWVLRIAHNLSIDHFRKEKRYPTIVTEDGNNLLDNMNFAENSIEDLQVSKDTNKLLRKLIQELPNSQKEVLIMRHYMDMSFKEIADATGVSINTALGRMRYAILNLRKKMNQYNIAYDQNIYPK
jgi:RNA polymerase sigma-70 factor (ECF subfamily)